MSFNQPIAKKKEPDADDYESETHEMPGGGEITIYQPKKKSEKKESAANRDAATDFMAQYPEWQGPERLANGHRRWTWPNPSDGRIHNVTCGSGTHSTDDSAMDARMLKTRINACRNGACNCRGQGEAQAPSVQQAAPFTPGQQAMLNGQSVWIVEVEDPYATIIDNAGQDDIVPITSLQRMSNILDPISTSLDPAVFIHPEAPDPQVNPKLNKWIHQAVYTALEKAGYEGPQRWLKMYLTGSLTTYQYSPNSDVDLNFFVNNKLPEWSRAEMIGILTKALDGVNLPGTNHPLQIFVSSKELAPKDKFKPGLRAAYDLDKDKWLVPPDKNSVHDVEHELNTNYIYALEIADKFDRLLRYEPSKAIHAYNVLHKLRQQHADTGEGDFNQYNVAYKYLSNHGYFDKLRNLGVTIH